MTAKEAIHAGRFAREVFYHVRRELNLPWDRVFLKLRNMGACRCDPQFWRLGYTTYNLDINMNTLRDYRDVLFAVAHEARHAQQFLDDDIEDWEARAAAIAAPEKPLKYRALVSEQEADEYGLWVEKTFEYDNVLINPDVRSLFIHVKVARHTLGL